MAKEFSFQWHITDFCNLRCKHCYQEIFDRRNELSYNELIKIIYNIVNFLEKEKFDSLYINLTGGEPLIFPYLNSLLEELDRIEIVKEISIITNGTFMPDKIIKREYKKLKRLKFSLEGAYEKTNDSIRGEGNFKRVLNNIKNTLFNFVLMFTLTKYNYTELDDMYRLAENLGAEGFILERFIPLGEGIKIKDKVLESYDWYKVVERVATWGDLSPEDLIIYKAFYIDFKENTIYGATCNIGEACAIMPNGDVYPCRRFPIVLGNLLREEFGEIYKKIINLRNEFTRNNLKGKCSLCFMDDCIGCRALAYSLTSDMFEEDFQCWKHF